MFFFSKENCVSTYAYIILRALRAYETGTFVANFSCYMNMRVIRIHKDKTDVNIRM